MSEKLTHDAVRSSEIRIVTIAGAYSQWSVGLCFDVEIKMNVRLTSAIMAAAALASHVATVRTFIVDIVLVTVITKLDVAPSTVRPAWLLHRLLRLCCLEVLRHFIEFLLNLAALLVSLPGFFLTGFSAVQICKRVSQGFAKDTRQSIHQ